MKASIPFLCLLATVASAEIIDASRRVTWQGNVGIPEGIPNSSNMTVYATMSSGASLATVQGAINGCPSNQVVELAAGSYTWASDLYLDYHHGVVLRGAGVGSTVVTFTDGGALMCRGTRAEAALSQEANLSQDAVKGESIITLAAVPSWVTAGELIGIDQLDDAAFVAGGGTSGGASYRELVGNGTRGLAQLNRVVSKTGTTITLETPLYYGFKTAQTAQIFQPYYNPSAGASLKRVGIEDLTITSTASGTVATVDFENAAECWMKNVAITNQTGFTAVWLVFAYRCEFTKMFIKDSHVYGGGQGYGIAPWHVSCGNLIYDSIFDHLHNAMTCNAGSSGNVFAYNLEVNGYSDASQNPGMNTHSVHPYGNLWEGNFCEDKLLTDWTHGSSSHNTAFRNRVTGENGTGDNRCCISVEYYNRYWNIVGNVLGTPGLQNKYLSDSSSTTEGSQGSVMKIGGEININNDYTPSDANSYTSGSFVLNHGNWNSVEDQINWESGVSDHALPSSLYLDAKPAWFYGLTWPPYNPTNTAAASLSITNLPAGYRYVYGTNPPAGETPAATNAVARVQRLRVHKLRLK